jgi:hypothetical protein
MKLTAMFYVPALQIYGLPELPFLDTGKVLCNVACVFLTRYHCTDNPAYTL